MQAIDLPEEASRPLSNICAGVFGLRNFLVNVFAVVEDDRWVLVDAGLHGWGPAIVRWARRHVSRRPPEAIVLTHGHFDHVGGLTTLLRTWDVPVYAHKAEWPHLSGRAAYPAPDPSVGGGLVAWLSGLYPRDPIDIAARLRELPDDFTVPGLIAWRWVPTPGHTAGHVSFYRAGDRTLLAGDAFCTTKQESLLSVAAQRLELHGPPAYFTVDWDAARTSVERLAALEPAIVAPSHGRPVAGAGITRSLHALARRFDTLARPNHGRYVSHPIRVR